MNYTEFTSKIENEVLNCIPDNEGLKATVNSITKNNGTNYDALTISRETKGINASPVIYLNGFYKDYLEGVSFNDILKEIASIYINNKDFSVSNLDFLENTENIIFNIINRKDNEELLKRTPYLEFLDDLAIIFRYVVDIEEDSIESSIIDNSLTDMDANKLYEYAIKNNKIKFTYSFRTMEDMLNEFIGIYDETEESNIGMYVVTNNIGVYGASIMAYYEDFKRFSDKLNVDKLYILPSSVHELIVVPIFEDDSLNIDELKDMVISVNGSVVDLEDILSDNIYLYNRQSNSISIC